jgi:hypothetical protein
MTSLAYVFHWFSAITGDSRLETVVLLTEGKIRFIIHTPWYREPMLNVHAWPE